VVNLYTKFEVSIYTYYKDMKGSAKCRKWVVWGWLWVTQGVTVSPFDRAHVISYSSLIETMCLSYHFRDTVSYLLKFANFNPLHLRLAFPLGVTPIEFLQRFLVLEN